MSNEYPAELFETTYAIAVNPNSMEALHRKLGYDLGKKYALADTGDWHNFTAAIKAGEPIDFEKLDGRKVRFTDGRNSVETVLEIDRKHDVKSPLGWNCFSYHSLSRSWEGKHDWTLWLDGEIPMKKQTADELPFGTQFFGREANGDEWTFIKVTGNYAQKFNRKGNLTASEIEVIEVLGMYGQKESE